MFCLNVVQWEYNWDLHTGREHLNTKFLNSDFKWSVYALFPLWDPPFKYWTSSKENKMVEALKLLGCPLYKLQLLTSDLFWPFEYQTSSVFRSLGYNYDPITRHPKSRNNVCARNLSGHMAKQIFKRSR